MSNNDNLNNNSLNKTNNSDNITKNIYTLDTTKFQPYLEEVQSKDFNQEEMIKNSVQHYIKPEDTIYYYPQNFVNIPTLFPTVPHLLKPNLYEKFDLNTLMFIFFYQNNLNVKYNIGKELSKRGWMYSKRYTTWFMLVPPAKSKTEDVIEGKFKFFDFEREWGFSIKKDFKFELKNWEKFES